MSAILICEPRSPEAKAAYAGIFAYGLARRGGIPEDEAHAIAGRTFRWKLAYELRRICRRRRRA